MRPLICDVCEKPIAPGALFYSLSIDVGIERTHKPRRSQFTAEPRRVRRGHGNRDEICRELFRPCFDACSDKCAHRLLQQASEAVLVKGPKLVAEIEREEAEERALEADGK
jgi:hypothetical protein